MLGYEFGGHWFGLLGIGLQGECLSGVDKRVGVRVRLWVLDEMFWMAGGLRFLVPDDSGGCWVGEPVCTGRGYLGIAASRQDFTIAAAFGPTGCFR